jgi:RimJ/RimL family protein N-acetyltransferase
MTTDAPTLPRPYEHRAPILTDRLALRSLEPGDVDAVHAYQSRPDVCRFLLFEPRTRDEVAAKVAEFGAKRHIAREGDFLQLAVVRQHDDVLVGEIYFKLQSVRDRTAEIGWVFDPAHGGAGFATEAARGMLGLAFGALDLHRVYANLDPRNDRSAALCRRLGMRQEAHFVQDMWNKGEWTDSLVFGILQSEFVAG